MESTAAVPTRADLVERGLAALSDDELERLADAMTRVWRSRHRMRLLSVALPAVGAAGFVMVAGGVAHGTGIALAALGMLSGGIAALLVQTLLGRSLAFEVEKLGYDDTVAGAVVRSAQRAARRGRPPLSSKAKAEACREELRRARAHSLPVR